MVSYKTVRSRSRNSDLELLGAERNIYDSATLSQIRLTLIRIRIRIDLKSEKSDPDPDKVKKRIRILISINFQQIRNTCQN
jgi:hypothetical protein